MGALQHIGASEYIGGKLGCQKLKDAGATKVVFVDHTGGTNTGVNERGYGCFTVFTGRFNVYVCA